MKRITIQGIAGCFHETAAHGSFPGEEVEVLPCVSFDEQFARMAAVRFMCRMKMGQSVKKLRNAPTI